MANQKKPNSKNLTGDQNPVIGDETEELDFESILAAYGGGLEEEPGREGSKTQAMTGTEVSGTQTVTGTETKETNTVSEAAGSETESIRARKAAAGNLREKEPGKAASVDQGKNVPGKREAVSAGTTSQRRHERTAMPGQVSLAGNARQQNGSTGARQSQLTGNAGQQNSGTGAGKAQMSGSAGQQRDAAGTGQARMSGYVSRQSGGTGADQAQSYSGVSQQGSGISQRSTSVRTSVSQPDTIDLVEVFYLMWGNLWKIILCLIAGAAVAFCYTWYLVTPQYEAMAKIYVVSSSSSSVINLSDLQLGTQLTADYEELILNHELLEDVIEALSLDMTYTQLKSMITITNPDDTRILRITVTSPDPVQARDIANELSEQAIIFLPEIMETAEPNIAEKAVLPTSASSPSYTRNTMVGGLVGAVACMGILLVLYLMDDTVKSPDDLEKYFGTQPLSTVAECSMEEEKKKKKKKGKAEDKTKTGAVRTSKSSPSSKSGTVPGTLSETAQDTASQTSQDGVGEEGETRQADYGTRTLQITKLPTLPFDVTESLNQLRVNLSFCGSGIKSIMITSSVPNEGKSFITINLWKMMARSGQKTLLIDADLRNSEMRSTYGITCEDKVKGIAYYLAGQAPLEQAVYATNIPNGYMIPMASSVANPSILLENGRFEEMIEECSKEFDYILIDTPPIGSVADALNIATHCDGTVLVVHGGETPRKLVANSIQLLKRTGAPLLGLVLNRAEISNRAGVYYYRRYYRYGGYYYKKGYGHYGYGYGASDKKNQTKSRK